MENGENYLIKCMESEKVLRDSDATQHLIIRSYACLNKIHPKDVRKIENAQVEYLKKNNCIVHLPY